MWHFISDRISEQLDMDFVCSSTRQLQGGDTHEAYQITDGQQRFFIKLNDKSRLSVFEAEVQGLEHIRQSQAFYVPRVICTGVVGKHSFLAMQYLCIQQGTPELWYEFGVQLAKLHAFDPQQMYGWQEENYAGPTLQVNNWHKKWEQFFAEQRIGLMLQLLAEKGHQLVDIDKAVDCVKHLLAGHQPQASMLHGDLWLGNTGFYQQQPLLFDPAFYFGDREVDLAMTELFGRFPENFYKGYEQQWALPEAYQYRKPIYQLYPLLNHALLFGGHYLESAKAILLNMDS